MEVTNNSKARSIVWACVYFLCVIAVCVSGVFAFKNFYYTKFVVNQNSMNPTLSGVKNNASYGICDKHKWAIDNLKRYQIVTSYFPSDYDSSGKLKENASLKIKRVLALPGERFKIVDYKVVLFDTANNKWKDPFEIPFDITKIDVVYNTPHKYYPDTTLSSTQYFLCGDNRDVSLDSSTIGPIEYTCLQGVVVKVQGHRRFDENGKEYFVNDDNRYFPGVDY